jgi:peptidoglycan hydrolase CwlO-like protein
MDKDTLDYIISRMEKQDKKISDLAETVDELSIKVYSLSEELEKLKQEIQP